ncbi:TPA: hypothetical protein L4Q76_001691 [Pseudomonas aeruginosa]|uniref:hypothetical protein n=1 Tax=Pseudomonas aeruginosa TaxID=287 RepID=UPI0003B989BB|nr:hypothetical protein [Pseudomonas aeruginosa]EKT9494435.1 hypothetical protein [Pseudomonas aeruginosa]ERY35627.1 hypothetical protein Q067_02262 [Pseudomonas aeruginosa BL13]MBH4028480.1 hypothetical protein [Pseudomonas aeruginosa]MBV5530550.1 hypothetical protein [Pseudomonas aeruginosa]MCS8095405.1 hypothetical protein [Pseudomonas aeruginosa]
MSLSELMTARAESIGYIALVGLGEHLPLQILRSAAGYYIGTADADGPVSRESAEYFPRQELAAEALKTGNWQQRLEL